MADTAVTSTAVAVIDGLLPPTLPTGAEIYDLIMGQIEPELTTTGIAAFDAHPPKETTQQTKARAAKYNKAFEEYDKRFAEYIAFLKEQVHTYRRITVGRAEQHARQTEQGDLSSLESTISAS